MQQVKIGRLQLAALLANLVFGKSVGFTSGALARDVGRDDWVAMSLAFLVGFVVMSLMVWIAIRLGGQSLTASMPRLVGRPLGKLALLLLAVFFFIAFMTSAITMELHLSDYLMTETPLIVFVLLWTLASMYGVYLGVEVIGRLSLLGFFFAVTIDVLMVAGSVQHFHLNRLFPLFDSGVLPTVAASTMALPDVSLATAAALVLLPLAGKPGKWLKLTWWGLLAGFLITIVWPVFEIGVLGPEVTAQYLISCMQMARAAELSIYLHRYELIMVIVFAYSVLAQSLASLWIACDLTDAALPFKVKRSILVPVLALLTIWPQYMLAVNRERYALFIARVWPIIALPIALGIPLLLAVVALFRRSARKPSPKPPAAPPPWEPPAV